MGLAFKKGDSVKQIVKVIEGVVVGPEIVDNDIKFKVAFIGEDGAPHERVFDEDQLELKE